MECEIAEFYSFSEPVARKEHRCCECDAPISKGEKHFHAKGKWGGKISDYRQHLLCLEACMYIRDYLNGGECICFGGMWEWHCESKWQVDRRHVHWRTIRKMLADIKRRERRYARV
jgi:hypothetical protein